MIPILFEKNETAFINNGIGRLRDTISATVTEERNSIYELDFEYPVGGANYDLIQCGRIVGVTHDESGDIQPFEIVSVTRPINGIVSFHCVHISYRQSQMTVSGTNINSLADAFTLLKTATPSNPFEYESDFTSSAYMSSADGTPRSVRQFLGGVKGSILDAYGGEFEWDKFRVILHRNRGETRDFAIRYGVNLLDYNDDTDYQGTFTSCVAYWKGTDGEIVSATASLETDGYNGNDIRVPLDLTDKFEEKPSASALQTEALAYMQRNQTNIPAQSIRVDFVRLAEMGEFSAFQDLLKCNLCDTIKVIFPMYNVSASFKIVKTVWNVLRGSYEEMELGTLSTTLAEALGIGETSSSSGGGGSGADYIVEESTTGIWTYRKWNSGIAECWGTDTRTNVASTTKWGNVYYGILVASSFPSGLFMEAPKMCNIHGRVYGGNGWVTQHTNMTASSFGTCYVITPESSTLTTVNLNIYAIGLWKNEDFTPTSSIPSASGEAF